MNRCSDVAKDTIYEWHYIRIYDMQHMSSSPSISFFVPWSFLLSIPLLVNYGKFSLNALPDVLKLCIRETNLKLLFRAYQMSPIV